MAEIDDLEVHEAAARFGAVVLRGFHETRSETCPLAARSD